MSILETFELQAYYSPPTGDIYVSQTRLNSDIIHRFGSYVRNLLVHTSPYKEVEGIQEITKDMFKSFILPIPVSYRPETAEQESNFEEMTDT